MSQNGLIRQINSNDFDIKANDVSQERWANPFMKHYKSLALVKLIHYDICGPLRSKTQRNRVIYQLHWWLFKILEDLPS